MLQGFWIKLYFFSSSSHEHNEDPQEHLDGCKFVTSSNQLILAQILDGASSQLDEQNPLRIKLKTTPNRRTQNLILQASCPTIVESQNPTSKLGENSNLDSIDNREQESSIKINKQDSNQT